MIKEVIFDTIKRRGFMLVLSSPSGAGKTTLAKEVLVHEKALELSISVTTRPKRESEKEGLDYYFVDEETFTQMVDEKQLLEHAYVYGYHYGTPKASIEKLLAAGTDVLFDIDWQGTQQLKQISMNDLVSVFLLPPTVKTLETRLRNRGKTLMKPFVYEWIRLLMKSVIGQNMITLLSIKTFQKAYKLSDQFFKPKG